MPTSRKIDPANVVWHAPETITTTLPDVADRLAKQLKDASTQEVLQAASQLSGEFREYLGEEEVNGRIVPQYGTDRLVWVSDAPDDPENTKGHYEVYKGDDDAYRPVLQRPEKS